MLMREINKCYIWRTDYYLYIYTQVRGIIRVREMQTETLRGCTFGFGTSRKLLRNTRKLIDP